MSLKFSGSAGPLCHWKAGTSKVWRSSVQQGGVFQIFGTDVSSSSWSEELSSFISDSSSSDYIEISLKLDSLLLSLT